MGANGIMGYRIDKFAGAGYRPSSQIGPKIAAGES
jgi:hypothetical protein